VRRPSAGAIASVASSTNTTRAQPRDNRVFEPHVLIADPNAFPAPTGCVRRVKGVLDSPYVIEYEGAFTFPVPVAHLWSTMVQFDRFPSWWSWLHEFSVKGSGLEHGTVLHGIVAPPLPYRMRLDVVVDECVPGRRITAFVHGDLEGAATLTFDGDGTEARVQATWTLEMMQRPMRMAARVAHPLLRWGHDRVVAATVDGFRRHLVGQDSRG
jgi:hypothetical protein